MHNAGTINLKIQSDKADKISGRGQNRMENDDLSERRRFDRSDFAYPVEIKFLSGTMDNTIFNGYIENISLGGACVQFEDRYGRVDPVELSDTKMKLIIHMPEGEKIAVLSSAKRVRINTPKQFFVEIGIEFESLEDLQEKAFSKLMTSKKKDQNMMWSLWGQFDKKV
jgi:c-di-GMP-binding flagellar brake protein YcgR